MDALRWVVLAGVTAYPFLFAYAYGQYRRGKRSRRSFLQAAGVGGPGFSVLLLQAADWWLASPADDAVAVASLVPLAFGAWALYRVYVAGGDDGNEGETGTN